MLNESNFHESIKGKKIIVMFYREKGCSFCDKAKPIFESFAGHEKGMYELGQVPDSVNTDFPVERFPTFYAFDDGKAVAKLEGVPTHEQLANIFNPQDQVAPKKIIKVEEAPLNMLVSDELVLIDQIAALKTHLNTVQAEIKKRKELAGVL